jgi:hypothetical protein
MGELHKPLSPGVYGVHCGNERGEDWIPEPLGTNLPEASVAVLSTSPRGRPQKKIFLLLSFTES